MSSDPDELRRAIDEAVVKGLHLALQNAADRWGAEIVGAERHEQVASRAGYRSGVRQHTFHFSVGPVTISVPKPRQGTSRPGWVPTLKRAPERLKEVCRELWLRGLSTRDLSAVSDDVAGRSWSHTSMNGWVKDVAEDTLRWLNRPVRQDIRYVMLDALYIPFVRKTSRKEALLVALGVTADGHKEVLDIQHAASESTDSWTTMLSRLIMRGLKTSDLDLVVTDGDAGLLAALAAQWPTVPRQRCTVHKVRQVVGRSSRELKKTAPKECSAIYKAPSRTEASRRAAAFIAKYRPIAPQLADIVENDLEACLTFYDHDANLWPALRTTNALERMNREFRRKLREIGAIRGEVNINRMAVQVAQFVNEDTKGKQIAGFKKRKQR
jgi:transposase-like protein